MNSTASVSVAVEAVAGARRDISARAARRRLIFVNRYFFPDLSATSQLLSDLVRGLNTTDLEIHVICSRQSYDNPHAQLAKCERLLGADIHRCWSSRFGRGGLAGRAVDYATFLLTASLQLMRRVNPGDVVVALTDPPMLSVLAAAITRLRKAHLVNWLQDVFPEVALALGAVRLPGKAAAVLLGLRNWTLRVAACNVVLGSGMRSFIRARGITAAAVRIIENWADPDGITPLAPERSSLRRSLCSGSRFVVQYSGNMGRAHEHETLLGAALELRLEKDWLFLFVGGGASMQSLRQRAEQIGLQNMCFLPLQRREDLGDSLAAGDVHVTCLLPSLEGLIVPSKLYGILAAGRPVIVIGDADGEQARVVRGARCGSVITCGNSAGLVEELRRMRAEPEWVAEAGRNARYLFERRYTLTSAIQKWRQLLEEVASPVTPIR